jgi:hypothetical protein
MSGRLIAFAVAAMLGTAPGAVAQEATIDTGAAGPVSAYGGRVVWSRKDPATGAYKLRTLFAGVVADVPVPQRRDQPFDVDLGPGAGASTPTVAVYSRCAGIDRSLEQDTFPGPVVRERGCDIYSFDFATGREHREAAHAARRGVSEFDPTYWRGKLVFAARDERARGFARHKANLYLTYRGGLRRLRGGPRGVYFRDRREGVVGGPGPTRLDLRGNTLAIAWYYHPGSDRDFASSAVLLTTLGDGRRVVEDTAEGSVDSPVLDAGRLYYLHTILDGASPTFQGIDRYDLNTRTTRTEYAPYYSVAATEGRFYAAADNGAIVEREFTFP